MGERKSYSVRLLPEVFKALKILSAKREQTVSALLEEAIKDLLRKHKEPIQK